MYCLNCGKENNENSKFCRYCGGPLGAGKAPGELYRGEQPQAGPAMGADPGYQNFEQPDYAWNGEEQAYPEGGFARNTEAYRRLKENAVGATPGYTKWMIAAACAFLALIAGSYLLVSVLARSLSPEKAAEKFFVAAVNGNYEKAFGYMNIEQDGLANPAGVQLALSETDFSTVDDYKFEYEPASPDMTERSVNIYYHCEGDEEESYRPYTIRMTKGEKGGKWSVSPENCFATNVTIVVPQAAKVTVDSTVLDGLYGQDTFDEYSGYTTTYTIPQISFGQHYVTVEADGRETAGRTWYVGSSGDRIEITDLAYSAETVTYLQQIAIRNMQKIYEAVLKGQDFSTIADLFTTNPERLASIQSDYEYLCNALEGEYLKVTNLTMSTIQANGDNYSSSVSLFFNYTAVFTMENGQGGQPSGNSTQNSATLYFDFAQENGAWLQTSLGCSSLYF